MERLGQAQHERPVWVSDFDFIVRVHSIDSPNLADFSVSSSVTSSGAIARDAALLAPTKALKTGVYATPHTAPQPLPIVDIVAEAAKLQEAMARGAQKALQARAPESRCDVGPGGAVTATQADA